MLYQFNLFCMTKKKSPKKKNKKLDDKTLYKDIVFSPFFKFDDCIKELRMFSFLI